MRYRLLLVVLCLVTRTSSAHEADWLESGAVGVAQALRSLQTTARILHVVAHPDDEDGAMMTYCARKLGARTMLFSITRGEGGANLISDHFFDQLGALRTLEHRKAAEFYGVDLFYSHAVDYGYSKTLQEARRQWQDGLPILEDLVEVIRREQPTILLSRFQGADRDGHGHHQMAGVVSRLAFDAAADPDRFPDQIAAGLRPWQIQKLYVNNIRPEWRPEDRGAWTTEIPTGDYDPVLGKTYAQIARYGLGFQRSQGISGHESDPEPRSSYYRLVRVAGQTDEQPVSEDAPQRESSVLNGIDTSLSGTAARVQDSSSGESLSNRFKELQGVIAAAANEFEFRNPSSIVPRLVEALRIARMLRDETQDGYLSSVLQQKTRELETAIRTALGIDVQCYATSPDGQANEFVIPGQKLEIHIRIANPSDQSIPLRRLAVDPGEWAQSGPEIDTSAIEANAVLETSFPVRVPPDASLTRPGIQRASVREPLYQTMPDYAQQSTPRCPLNITTTIEVQGEPIAVSRDVHTRIRHPEFGNVRYPIAVVPPIGVQFQSTDGVMPATSPYYDLDVSISSAVPGNAEGELSLSLPTDWRSEPASHPFQFLRAGESSTVRFRLHPAASASAGQHEIRATARYQNKTYSTGYTTVTAPDVGRMNVYRDAVHRLQVVDVQVAGNPRVGYITGSGDDVAESLRMLDVSPVFLSSNDLQSGSLNEFDVILVGVRAYAVRSDIRTHNQRLLDFVEKGGVLIVQYQTPEFDNNFGPYPYSMGRRPEEVSEEDAKVTILDPHHVLFTRPNQITSADFDGWVEQRGSKFLTSWDDAYTPLLECHDAGQDPQRGGMLVAKFGKGVYIYNAYAWYRQLPNGVPGAYRLFANMLSLPQELAEGREPASSTSSDTR